MPLTRPQQVVNNIAKEYTSVIPVITDVVEEVKTSPTNVHQMVNALWLLKKTEEALEGVQKKLREARRELDTRFCTLLAVTEEKNAKTEYATVTPNPSFYIAFPTSPDKPGFTEFIKQLPPEFVRPHYPSIEEHLGKELAAGHLPPFGLNLTGLTSSFGTRVLSRKDLA